MFMGSLYMIFICLGIGYMLLVAARKEKGPMRLSGYSLGIAIIVLTIISGLLTIDLTCPGGYKMGMAKHRVMKFHHR